MEWITQLLEIMSFSACKFCCCDSIAYLEVQINEPTAFLEMDACEEFVGMEKFGKIRVYSYSTFNSVMRLHSYTDLMIYGASPTNVVVEKACNEFTWNETTYTESGEYSFVTNNEFGCDSTITLEPIIYRRLFIPTPSPDNDGANEILSSRRGCRLKTLRFLTVKVN